MRTSIRAGLVSLMIAGGAHAGWAQAPATSPNSSSAPLSLTLADAVARGVAESPRLQAARARAAAAGATVNSRSALGLPTVTASGGYLRTNHVTAFGLPEPDGTVRVVFPDIPDNYQTRAELDVPVYTSGRVGALVDSARADESAAQATSQVTEQDLRLQIAGAYWALVTARENVRVLDDAQRRMDASVSDVNARLEVGLVPPNDLLSVKAARARQSVQLIQAGNDAAAAESQLDRLIGADPGQALTLVTGVNEVTPGSDALAAESLTALVARAQAGRSERGALRNRQASLEASGEAALAAARPSVAAYAAVQPARPNQLFVPRSDEWKTSWNLGVNVNWALWDGGKARADRAPASAEASAAGHDLEDFDAGLAVEIRQRLLDLGAGRASLDASADEVDAATEALRVVNERFDAGVATSTDVLDAEVALREAELERTRLAATLRLSEARLLRAVGAL